MKKTILVTGSSRGIGRAIALEAHNKGYKVIIHASSESKELDGLHKNLSGSIKTVFDVKNKKDTHEAIQKVLVSIPTIDVLINNAGIALNHAAEIYDVTDKKALEEWRVNVLGPIHCIQAVLPGMIKNKKGSIITIASIKGHPNYATLSSFTYGQTKAAVLNMTKSLAKTYSPQGVRFNSVSPGYVLTDISKSWTKETWGRVNSGILLDRISQPTEVASLVLYLASDEASYITGSDFVVDGGYRLKGK